MRDLDEPSTRQKQVLAALRIFIREHRYPPTRRELGAILGISSTNAVQDLLDALKRKGWVNWEPGTARTLRVLRAEPKTP